MTAAVMRAPAPPKAGALDPLKLQVDELAAALPLLKARDQDFAQSLCNQFRERGLSVKQAPWIGKLLARAHAGPPESADVGDFKGVIALLERAAQHLKFPAVLVRVPDGAGRDRDMRLNIACARAKLPGSINVCSVGHGANGRRDWFGRVTREGQFEPSSYHDEATQTAVAAALLALSTDPAKAAANYGHLTGRCCFCNRALDDPKSTEVGYGPVCARTYGLPWGSRKT